MNTIEKEICEAIDIIVNKKIQAANFDRTIQATVIECVDATTGKYKLKYQDSSFYAYSGSSDVTYPNNSFVYVLIPGSDYSKEKTILGTTRKLGSSLIPVTDEINKYEITGTNCLQNGGSFGLWSYAKGEGEEHRDVQTLYKYNGDEKGLLLNETAVEEYIKKSTHIVIKSEMKTALPAEQQRQGDYGIIVGVTFFDNSGDKDLSHTEHQVTKYWAQDINSLSGNPYRLNNYTEQVFIFDMLSPENFIRIDSISIYKSNFPFFKENRTPDDDNDILIKNIRLYGANALADDQLSGVALVLTTPQGAYFGTQNAPDSLPITAELRYKGSTVDLDTYDVPFYWFFKDSRVSTGSDYYNSYGGVGWHCLNTTMPIDTNPDETPVKQWVPLKKTYNVQKADVIAKELTYKCVAVYEGSIVTKTIDISNLASEYELTIDSDLGTQFYFDTGRPTLTCLVNGEAPTDVSWTWAVTSLVGGTTVLKETTEDNQKYEDIVNKIINLEIEIACGDKYKSTTKEELDGYKRDKEELDKVFRVEKNKLIKINVNTIDSFSTYTCTAYKKSESNEQQIGSASITLNNSNSAEGTYNLIINDSNYTYKYNEEGLSPTVEASDKVVETRSLTFTVYNNLGQKIDDDIIKHADKIEWVVPTSNTLLSIPSGFSLSRIDVENETAIYSNELTLPYSIAGRYDVSARRNDIELHITYKEVELVAKTNFTFVKEGDPGTNGTDYVCKIVPNVVDQTQAPDFIVATQTNVNTTFNFKPIEDGKYFKIELYHNEKLVYQGSGSGESVDDGGESQSDNWVTVLWEIQKNKYSSNVFDNDYYDFDNNHKLIYRNFNYTWNEKNTNPGDMPANIVKATVSYRGVTYYATFPIISVVLINTNYEVALKKNTGFLYATYTSDGRIPKYDNSNPFEFIVKERVTENGRVYWEDITDNEALIKDLSIEYILLGSIKDYDSNSKALKAIDCINLKNKNTKDLKVNQVDLKPVDYFDGWCVNNALFVRFAYKNKSIATMHIPIHLYLNRYGFSFLNDWDGNSININNEQGFILSPQIGAGKKDDNNAFTGVVMGELKDPAANESLTGLFGFSAGQRSIFLDAETGKSEFGLAGKGRIIIDPSSGHAQIYGGNYVDDPKKGSGLLIDLTEPFIKFGNQNFSVNKDGHLVAKGGGSIAGWNIDNDSLFTGTKDTSSNIRISSVDFSRSINGVNRTGLRMSFGTKFAVSKDGTMYAGDAVIGTGSSKITIGQGDSTNSAIYSGTKSSLLSNNNGFYLGTDGIALGARVTAGSETFSRFQVTSDGKLYATEGYIGNGTQGWTITARGLSSKKTSFGEAGKEGIFLGSAGIQLGDTFKVDSQGNLTATSGTIGGWKLTSAQFESTDKKNYIGPAGISFNNGTFHVDSSGNATVTGKITATSGKIGSWRIEGTSLIGKDYYDRDAIFLNCGSKGTPKASIYFNDNASLIVSGNLNMSVAGESYISSSGWSINGNGKATFSDVAVTGGSITLGGTTLNSTGTALSSRNTTVDNTGIAKYVGDIAANKIEATTIQTKNLRLDYMYCDTSVAPDDEFKPGYHQVKFYKVITGTSAPIYTLVLEKDTVNI